MEQVIKEEMKIIVVLKFVGQRWPAGGFCEDGYTKTLHPVSLELFFR
jgi:hypothetical protein